MRKQKGFSLIELLIVVAIILIIAAIAIPNLLRSRMAANEASAVGSIRSVNTAEVTYASTYSTVGYSATMAALGGTPAQCAAGATSNTACLIDQVVAAAIAPGTAKSGYFFTYVPSTGAGGTLNITYTVNGDPAALHQTGERRFFSDESGVIRFTADGSAATNASNPLQ